MVGNPTVEIENAGDLSLQAMIEPEEPDVLSDSLIREQLDPSGIIAERDPQALTNAIDAFQNLNTALTALSDTLSLSKPLWEHMDMQGHMVQELTESITTSESELQDWQVQASENLVLAILANDKEAIAEAQLSLFDGSPQSMSRMNELTGLINQNMADMFSGIMRPEVNKDDPRQQKARDQARLNLATALMIQNSNADYSASINRAAESAARTFFERELDLHDLRHIGDGDLREMAVDAVGEEGLAQLKAKKLEEQPHLEGNDELIEYLVLQDFKDRTTETVIEDAKDFVSNQQIEMQGAISSIFSIGLTDNGEHTLESLLSGLSSSSSTLEQETSHKLKILTSQREIQQEALESEQRSRRPNLDRMAELTSEIDELESMEIQLNSILKLQGSVYTYLSEKLEEWQEQGVDISDISHTHLAELIQDATDDIIINAAQYKQLTGNDPMPFMEQMMEGFVQNTSLVDAFGLLSVKTALDEKTKYAQNLLKTVEGINIENQGDSNVFASISGTVSVASQELPFNIGSWAKGAMSNCFGLCAGSEFTEPGPTVVFDPENDPQYAANNVTLPNANM